MAGRAGEKMKASIENRCQTAFESAVGHHQAGRLAEAEKGYRGILESEPGHAGALHLLGMIGHQTGNPGLAVKLIAEAVAIAPDYAEAHHKFGTALSVQDKPEEEKTGVRRGHSEEDPNEKVVDAARRLVANALRRGYTIETLAGIFTDVISLADGIRAALRKVGGPPKPKACRAGCTYCCHFSVEVSVPEVLSLASYINANFSESELEAVKTRVHETERRVRGLNSYERLFARVPCPLLLDGKCSVYAARPLVCRGYNSFNWVTCAQDMNYSRSWRLIPHDEAERDIYSNVLDGLVTGLKEEGLPSVLLELIAALRIALDQPDAGERWLAGEAVFEPAAAPEE